MSEDFKTSTRGGARQGAGRKPAFDTNGEPTPTTINRLSGNFKPSVNVLKELEKLYKELKKKGVNKDEVEVIRLKIDVLNKLLPYSESKMPTAPIQLSQKEVPEFTVLKVIGDKTEENDGDNTV